MRKLAYDVDSVQLERPAKVAVPTVRAVVPKYRMAPLPPRGLEPLYGPVERDHCPSTVTITVA